MLRLKRDPNVAVLAAPAGLAHKPPLLLDFLANRFLVRHLGLANVGADVKFAQQTIDDDFQVQFTHAGDNGLAGFLIGSDLKRRIFGGKLLQ